MAVKQKLYLETYGEARFCSYADMKGNETMDMKEKRAMVKPVGDLLEYKIRSGKMDNGVGQKIWQFALKNPGFVDQIMNILDMELPDNDTLAKVERLA